MKIAGKEEIIKFLEGLPYYDKNGNPIPEKFSIQPERSKREDLNLKCPNCSGKIVDAFGLMMIGVHWLCEECCETFHDKDLGIGCGALNIVETQ